MEAMNKKILITALIIAVAFVAYLFFELKSSRVLYTITNGDITEMGDDFIVISGVVASSDPNDDKQESRTIKFKITSKTAIMIVANTIDFNVIESGVPFSPETEKRSGSISDISLDARIARVTSRDNLFESNEAKALAIDQVVFEHINFPNE